MKKHKLLSDFIDFVIKEIKSTLKDCKNSIKDYELSNEGGDHINQGWIEALEYVINTYNFFNKEK